MCNFVGKIKAVKVFHHDVTYMKMLSSLFINVACEVEIPTHLSDDTFCMRSSCSTVVL